MKDLLQAKSYSFTYANDEKPSLNNINLTIYKGEVILLTGNSGCGKSTLIKAMNGLIPNLVEGTTSGSFALLQKEVKDTEMFDISKNVGSVFQNPRSQFFTTNTTSELVFAMENFGYSREEMQHSLERRSKQFHLSNLLDRNIYTLSSGERQLLALACANSLDEQILLFDEPSANLDYGHAMKLNRFIKDLKQKGYTILIADHRFYYLNDVLDRVFLLEDGNLTIFESVQAFKDSTYPTRSFSPFDECLKTQTATHTNKVVEVSNVCYKNILKDVSFDLYDHEICVLVGTNGAGKSTLARLLSSSIKQDSGSIKQEKRPFYIAQDADYQLFGSSVYDELCLTTKDIDETTILNTLDRLELLKLKDKHPFDLSGGEKQRLQIGLATLSDAPLLIFDEPTSGLDVNRMKMVCNEIKKLQANASILVITHDYEFIMEVAQRVMYLHNNTVERDFQLDSSTMQTLQSIFIEMEQETVFKEETL